MLELGNGAFFNDSWISDRRYLRPRWGRGAFLRLSGGIVRLGQTQPPANRFDPIRGHWSSRNKIRRDFPISFPVVLAPVEHVKLRRCPAFFANAATSLVTVATPRIVAKLAESLGGWGVADRSVLSLGWASV